MKDFLTAVGATAAAISVAQAAVCQLDNSPGGSFDLRALRRTGLGNDYKVLNQAKGETFNLNFCGPVNTATWAVEHSELVGAYIEGEKGGISLGQYAATPAFNDGILSLTYTGGSACPSSNARRASVIELQCDNSWGAGEVKLVSAVEDCNYFFTMKTPHACPATFTSSVFSSIGVFVSILLIAGLAAFLSAVAYNRFVLKQRGMEQVPSIERLRDGVSFVKDMAIIIGVWLLDVGQALASKLSSSRSRFGRGDSGSTDYSRGAWSRSARDGFQSVSSSASGLGGIGGGGSLLEEDEDEDDEERGVGSRV